MAAPPFDLVQLSTLPQETWRGRAVFHPIEQHSVGPIWDIPDDARETLGIPDYIEGAYDVGVVEDWEPDPDFADDGVIRVRFVTDSGSRLRYGSWNLWTPRLWVDPR